MKKVVSYFSLIKFSHTIFALPFAIVGFFLALSTNQVDFNIYTLILIVLAMVFARSAAMAFNRFLDADIDAQNERTAGREIPSGVISKKSTLIFTIISCLLFIVTTWYINLLCFYLSPIALAVILVYSYTKRFTLLCHFVLGLGLSLAPIGAYLAVVGEFALVPLLFSAIVFCWTSGFDIMYALQDQEFDSDFGLFSIPAKVGSKKALYISSVVHVFAAGFVVLAGIVGSFSFIYWIGAVLFFALLVYQHSLVSPKDISRINMAFATSNGLAGVLFSVCTVVSMYFPA